MEMKRVESRERERERERGMLLACESVFVLSKFHMGHLQYSFALNHYFKQKPNSPKGEKTYPSHYATK